MDFKTYLNHKEVKKELKRLKKTTDLNYNDRLEKALENVSFGTISYRFLNKIDSSLLDLTISKEDIAYIIKNHKFEPADTIKKFYSINRLAFDFRKLKITSNFSKDIIFKGYNTVDAPANRLISISQNSNEGIICDIFDILKLYDIDLFTLKELNDSVKIKELEVYQKQKDSYTDLSTKFDNIENYKNLNSILKNNLVKGVLDIILERGNKLVHTNRMCKINHQNYSVFSFPIVYISEKLNLDFDKYKSKISDAINILVSIKIIKKVFPHQLRTSKNFNDNVYFKTGKGHEANYFYITNSINLDEVENVAVVLKSESVRIGHISKKIITSLFSNTVASRIFNVLVKAPTYRKRKYHKNYESYLDIIQSSRQRRLNKKYKIQNSISDDEDEEDLPF